MKRVLLIAYSLDPNDVSESVKAAYWLKLISQYYEVDAVTINKNRDSLLSLGWKNINYHFVDSFQQLREIEKSLKIYGLVVRKFYGEVDKLLEQFDLEKFEFIHCLTPSGIYAYNNLYKLNLPLLVGPMGGGLATPKRFDNAFKSNFLKNLARDFYYFCLTRWRPWIRYVEGADVLLAGTDYIRDMLPDTAQDKTDIIFDTVVDTNVFQPKAATTTNQSTSRPLKILYAGRLVPSKGPMLLLEAVKLCKDQGAIPFKVEICGSGFLRSAMAEFITGNKLEDHITLHGQVDRPRLMEMMQTSDIFCLPTLREPGGATILEAMACGLPIITTDYGGPRYSVNDNCGIKIPLTHYDDYVLRLAEAITHLLGNESKRATMASASRERAINEFSVSALENKIRAVYKKMELISDKKRQA